MDYGPVVTAAAKANILRLIETGVAQGAKLVVDGRNFNLQGYRTNPINHSLAVKKEIMRKSGTIGLGIDNFVTPSYDVYSELNSAYLKQSTTNTLYNFIVKVNFSYRIGRVQESKSKKELLDEERDN